MPRDSDSLLRPNKDISLMIEKDRIAYHSSRVQPPMRTDSPKRELPTSSDQ